MKMTQRHPSFDYFDFTEAYIGIPDITDTTIRVPIRKFVILGGHPDYLKTTHFTRCVLVYEKVAHSKRTISKYGEPKIIDGKTTYLIESEDDVSDGPFMPVNEPVFLHHLSGVSEEPHAWLNWDIVAVS